MNFVLNENHIHLCRRGAWFSKRKRHVFSDPQGWMKHRDAESLTRVTLQYKLRYSTLSFIHKQTNYLITTKRTGSYETPDNRMTTPKRHQKENKV